MMHVAHVNVHADPQRRPPDALLEAWPTLLRVAGAVRDAGVRVSVVQAAAQDAQLVRDDIAVHFVRVPGTRRGALRVARAVRALEPDAIHLQGLRFPLHLRALRHACPGVPIVAQDHADDVPGRLRARVERALAGSPDAVLFTGAERAAPMIRAGLLPPDVHVFDVPESTSHFTPGDREEARRRTGIHGDPCILWVGRLDPVKDPITALEAFRLAARALPDARLWCVFGAASMLPAVQEWLEGHADVRQRIELIGPVTHDRIEWLMRAADMLLMSSARESTGYAVIEALACGLPVVGSDIPALRALTNGMTGARFPVGDAPAAAAAIRAVAAKPPPRTDVRAHFDRHASSEALGAALRVIYEHPTRTVIEASSGRRARLRVCMLVPGGVDRSGTHRVIPCLLALIERLAREVDLHVLALRQESYACEYDLLGARVHCVPSASRTAAVRWLLRTGRDTRWDALHALWMHPQGTAAAIAGPLLATPVVLHLNGGDLAALPDIGFGGRHTLTGRLRLRLAVAGADRITAPGAQVVAAARTLGIDAQRVTYGVDLERWPPAAPRPRSPNEPLQLLSVGTLNRVKDHATLLRAVARLRATGVDAQLSCVGADLMGGTLQQLSRELGIADRVCFHGFLPHDLLRAHFDRAHVLVVSSRFEADPVAALEAAVAGVAVAGTAVGHLVEWAPAAAAICPPGDPDALAGVIERLARDDTARCRIARVAQTIALAHDADRAASRMLDIYHEVARARA